MSWAGFNSVFKNKGKPEEREEERAAFENLFCHSQLMTLSTHSLGQVVVNTRFLIIIVWGSPGFAPSVSLGRPQGWLGPLHHQEF